MLAAVPCEQIKKWEDEFNPHDDPEWKLKEYWSDQIGGEFKTNFFYTEDDGLHGVRTYNNHCNLNEIDPCDSHGCPYVVALDTATLLDVWDTAEEILKGRP